jgi:phosphate transport system substrate-binding protein
VHKADGRATQKVFITHFGLKNSEIEPDAIVGENQQAIKTVAGNPWSIGHVSIGAADSEAQRGTPIRLLPLEGVEPTAEALRDGQYPLVRPLNLVTRDEPKGEVRKFVEFAQSPTVKDLIKAQYFVPVGK